jgi:hypothetical protein
MNKRDKAMFSFLLHIVKAKSIIKNLNDRSHQGIENSRK